MDPFRLLRHHQCIIIREVQNIALILGKYGTKKHGNMALILGKYGIYKQAPPACAWLRHGRMQHGHMQRGMAVGDRSVTYRIVPHLTILDCT
jgi:hypothetical protein